MKRWSCYGAVALATALLFSPAARAADEPFQVVSPDQVAKMIGAPDVRILDANPEDVYAKAHLPGAVFVKKPLESVLPKDKGARLVFYCKNPK